MLTLQAACGFSSATAESSAGKVIDRADIVASHHFEDLLRLRAVEVLVGALGRKLRRHHAQIGGDDPIGAVVLAQGRNKLRADLAKCAGDQNPSHVVSRKVVNGRHRASCRWQPGYISSTARSPPTTRQLRRFT